MLRPLWEGLRRAAARVGAVWSRSKQKPPSWGGLRHTQDMLAQRELEAREDKTPPAQPR
jgi:hypothetical protein